MRGNSWNQNLRSLGSYGSRTTLIVLQDAYVYHLFIVSKIDKIWSNALGAEAVKNTLVWLCGNFDGCLPSLSFLMKFFQLHMCWHFQGHWILTGEVLYAYSLSVVCLQFEFPCLQSFEGAQTHSPTVSKRVQIVSKKLQPWVTKLQYVIVSKKPNCKQEAPNCKFLKVASNSNRVIAQLPHNNSLKFWLLSCSAGKWTQPFPSLLEARSGLLRQEMLNLGDGGYVGWSCQQYLPYFGGRQRGVYQTYRSRGNSRAPANSRKGRHRLDRGSISPQYISNTGPGRT